MNQPLTPKKRKYRKAHVGNIRGLATAGSTLAAGDYGLKVLEGCDLKLNQIEAARVAARKATKRYGQIIFRIQADLPKSKKPLEVRMGSGKGPVDHYAARVKPGRIIFEICGVSLETARDACRRAAHKIPVKTAFISRVPVVE
jgi:large subunit ribosomal protein L16